MKSITLEAAAELLNNCDAVIVDDGALTFPSVGDPGEEIAICWDDSDGQVFENFFAYDADLTEAFIDADGRLVLRDYVDNQSDTQIAMKLLYWKKAQA